MKDIAAMIKNKLVVSIILGAAFVMLSASALPLLMRLEKRPSVLVYDPGQSATIRKLAADENIRLGFSDTRQEMEDVVSTSPDLLIGLVVPADFDQEIDSAHPVILTSYLPHWVNANRAARQIAVVEERLRELSGGMAAIQVSENVLYPPAEIQGRLQIFAMTFSIVLFTFGIALVPLLMVEEKQSHTMDVLLVSPASFLEVVMGKAAAGMFYCLLASTVVLLFNQHLVVHWGIALLAVLLGSSLAVSIGLLIGQLSDNPTAISLWGSMILLGMMILTMLGLFSEMEWPALFQLLLDYLPTTALVRLLGFSLAGYIPSTQVWINAGALFVFVIFFLGITSRVMRRMVR
jgi:ABC-2 type transport system permease protein